MKIVEIRDIDVPLTSAFSNAVVSFDRHKVSLVAITTDVVRNGRPLVGVAFNSIGRHAQSGILRDRMIPRILEADPDALLAEDTGVLDPAAVLRHAMADEKPGGHGDRAAAASALELACWDLLAKYHDEPAYQTIARAYGRSPLTDGAEVYAAGGYYQDSHDLSHLRGEISGYLSSGYTSVKIKIGGRPLPDDLKRIEAAIELLGAGDRLAVDANGRFGRAQALEYAHALAPYGLRWYEEPVDPLDYALHQELAATYDAPLATGENLFSTQDVQNLLRFGGLRPDRDILQMDAGLSYGLAEYDKMISAMEEHGFDRTAALPHGGHLLNLHIVIGLNLGACEAYSGLFQPFGGYSPECTISDGRIWAAELPGFGLEAKLELRDEIAGLVG